ncbi:MAG TPA: nuclear transport factor 2 family protein [Caulobacteraceae bacterium]
MTEIAERVRDQTVAIEAVITARNRALSAKDAEAVADCQTSDFVCFSIAPPLVARDPTGLQAWFDTWDGPIGYAMEGLTIVGGADVAFAHALVNMTGRKRDGYSADLWFRLTLGLKRGPGGWKIAHEHDSTPFYMDGSFRAAVDLKP